MAMSILLFSVLDSILTLQLIARGADELNPLVGFLIDMDVGIFAWTKTVVTAVVLVLLVTHANHKLFGVLRVRKVLLVGLVGYVCLVAYEAVLLIMFQPLPQLILNG